MPLRRERCLLLCMAYPDYSESYGATVCMAGITEGGDLRRIYPVPFDKFREINFQKRRWIEYDVIEKGDHRKESYKIDPDSVEIGDMVPYPEVGRRIEERAITIEELNQRKDDDDTSLGFVRPEPDDLLIQQDEERAQRAKQYNEQMTLSGDSMPVEVIPHYLRYQFSCGDGCVTSHEIMCEDIEIGMLYRNLMDEYNSLDIVEEKIREKFVDWMVEERDLYFMLGTHFTFGSWLIVSVLYPENVESERLDRWVN